MTKSEHIAQIAKLERKHKRELREAVEAAKIEAWDACMKMSVKELVVKKLDEILEKNTDKEFKTTDFYGFAADVLEWYGSLKD